MLGEILAEAAAGRFPAAAELIRRAGYAPAGERFRVDGYGPVAGFFAVSERTVKNWSAEGMPGGKVGKGRQAHLDLQAIAAWLTERWRKDQVMWAGGGTSPSLEEWRKARASEAQIDLAERRSEVVSRAAAEAAMSAGASAFVGGLTNLREKLSRLAPAAADEIAVELDSTAARVREALSAYEGAEKGETDAAA